MTTSLVLALVVRAAIILGVALIATRVLVRAAAVTRRAILAFAFLAVTALPVAMAVLPVLHLGGLAVVPAQHPARALVAVQDEVTPAAVTATIATPPPVAAPPATSQRPSLALLLGIAWALGAAAVLARLVVGHLRAHRMARAGTLVETRQVGARSIEVRTSAALDTPAVMGVLTPVVLLPRDSVEWTAERREIVLAHELAHVAHRDGVAVLLAQVACAVHWFDPLVWVAARRLRMESEHAADDQVLGTGIRAWSYAEHLLHLATRDVHVPAGALGMAEPSQVEHRIRALLAPNRSRRALARTGQLALLAVGSTLAALVACATPDPEPADAPKPVVLAHTGDPQIQAIVDSELARLGTDWAPRSAIAIVLDPQTGRIVAVSTRGAADAGHPILPGSTVKPFVMAAALDEGVITTTDRFDATPSPTHDEVTIVDSDPHGILTVGQILAVSSNIGTAKVFAKLGGAHLAAWGQRFHLAAMPTAIPDTTSGAAIAIGAGFTSTPLEITAAFATLADDGIYHAPTVDGPVATGERVVRSDTAASVLALLEGVTQEGGTGTAARIEGVRVAGKTGTAHVKAGSADYYASFVGTAPLEHPRYVVFVGAEAPRDGGSGGQVAAPAFARIMTRLLSRAP